MAVKCPSCDATFEPSELLPCYECGDCGTVFTKDDSADGCSHTCPDCHKFAAKSEQMACPECSDTTEEDQYENVQVWASNGAEMDAGEVPACEYCGATADQPGVTIYDTPSSGVYCCDKDECCIAYVTQNSDEFELVDS
jgi:hypothetical protein